MNTYSELISVSSRSKPSTLLWFLWCVLWSYWFCLLSFLCFCFYCIQQKFFVACSQNVWAADSWFFLTRSLKSFNAATEIDLMEQKTWEAFQECSYFLLRIIIHFAATLSKITLHLNQHFVQGFVFTIAALLIALSWLYKKTYINVIDTICCLTWQPFAIS